jgi:RNA-directed DNA polymerase
MPTIYDRCLQALVKNALEPSWEARFEGTSYGFRPGRGCHDAIGRIYLLARPHKRKRWVVDADIKGAFDHIDHGYLLRTIGPFPARELIRQWLKAGYLEQGAFYPTEEGTPQGGVISPLLANIALHGMEEALGVRRNSRGEICGPRAVVRYADDFVCFCETKEDADYVCEHILPAWLAHRGLTLSPEKTRVVHLTEGFDFLGFTIRHYRDATTATGYKLLITPSKAAVKVIRQRLRDEWRALRSQSATAVVQRLNPVIRGQANYYRIAVATRTFKSLDHYLFQRAWRYAQCMHRNKPARWRKNRYWSPWNQQRADRWVFGDKHTGVYLLKYSWFPIQRHVLIQGAASPDDATLRDYFADRMQCHVARHLPAYEARIAQRTRGQCAVCREPLLGTEHLEQHHLRPRSQGGTDDLANKVLVHLYCHQWLHAPGKEADRLAALRLRVKRMEGEHQQHGGRGPPSAPPPE